MESFAVPVWMWGLAAAILGVSLATDLVAHRGSQVDSPRRALAWSIAWVTLALLFNLFVAIELGAEAGHQFLAAYLLEKSLSVDNLFVFMLVFGSLQIPRAEQRRVLTWGIVGAIVMRGLLIFAGAAAVSRWHAVTYVFGALLLFGAVKMLREPPPDQENRALVWLERHLPWTRQLDGHHFVTRVNGKLMATPLLLALIAIELTDVLFAIDSVPAAFAVTTDTFIIYSSNMFAILGLRALYIVLAGALANLRYLRFGLAAVLAFAAVKLLIAQWAKIPPLISVGVIAVLIGSAIAFSVRASRREQRAQRAQRARRAEPE